MKLALRFCIDSFVLLLLANLVRWRVFALKHPLKILSAIVSPIPCASIAQQSLAATLAGCQRRREVPNVAGYSNPAETDVKRIKAQETEPLLTVQEAAARCRLSVRQMWRHIEAERLKVVRFGRSVRVQSSELEGFIDRHSK